MDPEAEYVHRGTTLGWPGTTINRSIPMTCTSSDPLVATVFALECMFRGPAIVLFALRETVQEFCGPSNFFDERELAVNLVMKPSEFMEYVVHQVDGTDAREILVSMGFDVPYLIYGLDALSAELALDPLGRRLSREQVADFNRLAFENRT